MELHLSRREIRRRILARLGHTTNDAQAPLVQVQYNELIRAAAQEVYLRCPWQHAMRETRTTIGIDQRVINYPDSTGAQEIQALAVWDASAGRYVPLRRGVIPLALDDDPVQDAGEPEAIAGRARPSRYELKNQIELWPRPDQEYEVKIDHTISPDMGDDEVESVVDAEAIILLVMAEAYGFQGDSELAKYQRSKAEDRLGRLIAGQHPMPVINRGGRHHHHRTCGYEPTSGQWPSRVEDQQ